MGFSPPKKSSFGSTDAKTDSRFRYQEIGLCGHQRKVVLIPHKDHWCSGNISASQALAAGSIPAWFNHVRIEVRAFDRSLPYFLFLLRSTAISLCHERTRELCSCRRPFALASVRAFFFCSGRRRPRSAGGRPALLFLRRPGTTFHSTLPKPGN